MEDIKQVIDTHIAEYGNLPEVIVSAPGRFHLMGEHSWFFKDKTLSMAVNLPVYVAISQRQDSALRFYFPQLKERKRSNTSSLKFRREDRWANAVKAMIYGFLSSGCTCNGMNVTVYSNILPSAGFGITTAIKVAAAMAVRELFDFDCSDSKLLQIIAIGNKQFLNSGNYLADIYAAFYAEEGCCILTDHAKSGYTILPFDFTDTSILLTDARVPRIIVWDEETLRSPENVLLMGELKEVKNGTWLYENSDTEINDVLSVVNEDTRRRLLCIMKENQYAMDAAEGLKNTSFTQFARAVNRSHEIMRDLYTISCPEIDWLVKRVLEFDTLATPRNPTACSRITGKGFGRCTYTILPDIDVDNYKKKLVEYERIFGFHPSCYQVKPVRGAFVVRNWK